MSWYEMVKGKLTAETQSYKSGRIYNRLADLICSGSGNPTTSVTLRRLRFLYAARAGKISEKLIEETRREK